MRHIGSTLKKAPPRRPRGHYSVDDQLTILWGISQNWTNGRIGTAIGAAPSWVRTYRCRLMEDPTWIFDLPVVLRLAENRYRCELCGATRKARLPALKHVLAHFFQNEVVQTINLSKVKLL